MSAAARFFLIWARFFDLGACHRYAHLCRTLLTDMQ